MPDPTSHSARLKSWMVVGAACGVLALGWGLRKWTEPRFHGRGIRSWIEQLPYDQSSSSESQEAMRYFGERAVPYLIEAMMRPRNGRTERWRRFRDGTFTILLIWTTSSRRGWRPLGGSGS